MNPEIWKRAKEIFAELAGAPRASRLADLDRHCAGDPELRALLLSMLAGGETPADFLDQPALRSAGRMVSRLAGETEAPDPAVGWTLGPYHIKERIGAGGMGAVYLASRTDGQFEQEVAVKLVKRGLDTDEVLARFRRERQLLASLDHPNIAGLIDGGAAPDGRPYLVMSFIRGRPIDEYCREQGLQIDERVRLFCTVCEAVHYAHQNLVVHRDLKPANILVPDEGAPKLLDFGIAKVLEPGPEPTVTAPERRLLTPGFASPEQVLGLPVSTASDIYSLGVVLYHLLAGRAPYEFRTGTDEELRRVVCETDPPPPGQTVRRAAASAEGAAGPAPRLGRDLDNIVLMAMHKDPARRYASAEHLAADLRRYLGGLPVLARPGTFGYRARKFVQRNRVGVGVAAVVALLLAGSVVGIVWQAHVAGVQRDRAVLAHEQADEINEFLQSILQSANVFGGAGPDVTVRELLDDAAERARLELADHPAVLAPVLSAVGGAYTSLGLYDQAEPLLRDALEMTRPLPDAAHDLPARLNDMATLLYSVGRLDEAERAIREALALEESGAGRGSEGAALTLNNLGAVLRSQDRLDEAEAALREALAIRRRLFGNDDLAIAETLNNLANIFRVREDSSGAEEMLRESLRIRELALGEDHPLVAQSLSNLAVLVHSAGDLEAAEPLYARALELEAKSLGEDHPDRASTLLNFGLLRVARGDHAGAEPLLREALGVRRRVLPADDPRLLMSAVELGRCLSALARHDEAIEMLRGAYRAALSFEQGARYQAYAAAALADAYEAAGRPDEAAALR